MEPSVLSDKHAEEAVVAEAGLEATRALRDEAEVARAAALNRALDDAHHRVMDGPHWYLPFMAVAPAQQGRGSGSALMRHALDRVIPRGAPCYLDSVDERNLPFYEQLGFWIAETGVVPGSQLRTWALRRG